METVFLDINHLWTLKLLSLKMANVNLSLEDFFFLSIKSYNFGWKLSYPVSRLFFTAETFKHFDECITSLYKCNIL